jgi:glycerol uptake facilitator-like aquaporin
LLVSNKVDRRYAVAYWIAQIAGAMIASVCPLIIAKTPAGFARIPIGLAQRERLPNLNAQRAQLHASQQS